MSKKIKILLAVVAALVVLTVGSGVIVLANGEQQTTPGNPLFAKVAAILGNVTEQQLTDAFKQAREQVAKEAVTAWLAKAVTDGNITATEKIAIETWLAQRPVETDKVALKAWWDKRPEIAKPGLLKGFLRAPGNIKQFDVHFLAPKDNDAVFTKVAAILNISVDTLKNAFQQAGTQLKTDNFNKFLDKAAEKEKITPGEAEQIKSWWAQRPPAVDKIMPVPGKLPEKMPGRVKGGMMRLPKVPGIRAQ